MNSESIIAIILALLGAVVFYKTKADKSGRDAILGDTKGQDKILKENQDKAAREALEADQRIKEFYRERETLKDMHETKEERADNWNKDKK